MKPHRHAAAVVMLGLGVVACTTTSAQRDPPKPTGAPTPVASAPALPDAGAWVKDWPKTWTDPRVVDALALACDFDPKRAPPSDGMSTPLDMFACTPPYMQSCRPDVCLIDSNKCEHGCTSTCLGCSGTCTSSCTTCKAPCTDDACRHRCAEQCAQCKEACVTGLDRCTSADCGKAHADCEKRLRASWKKAGCGGRCKRWSTCSEGCDRAKDSEACRDRCNAAVAPGFGACQKTCDELRESGKDEAGEACLLECYVKEPCAPFLCMSGMP